MAGSTSNLSLSIPETAHADKKMRLSKRKRLKSIFRRLRRYLTCSTVQVEREVIQSNNDTLLTEETKEHAVSPSSYENATNYLLQEPSLSAEIEMGEIQALLAEEEEESTILSASNEVLTSTRQSKAADATDLSGTWIPIVTSAFKKEYDSYLVHCGENIMFRKIVVNGISYQREVVRQLNDGIELEIVASNPAGNWKRTLVTSDNVTIIDPDGDKVQVESWWEGNGTKHRSILRGKPRVQGGVFDTVRYLESENVLVCESKFIPMQSSSKRFTPGHVRWKFQRDSI